MFTITFGYWVFPAVITVIAVLWAGFKKSDSDGDWIGGFAEIIDFMIRLIIALGISLVSWLSYVIIMGMIQ